MPRVTTVQAARKDQGTCGKCGDPLPPGTGYRWWKFRYGGRYRRCLKSSCYPTRSDLTNSGNRKTWYGIEDALGTLGQADSHDALEASLDDLAAQVEDFGYEWEEKADNVEEHFPDDERVEEWRSFADDLSSWADTLRSAMDDADDEPDHTAFPGSGDDEGDAYDEAMREWVDTIVDAVTADMPEYPG
jgi:hypothetical protein